jgi:hypothetical protein
VAQMDDLIRVDPHVTRNLAMRGPKIMVREASRAIAVERLLRAVKGICCVIY